MKSRSMKVVLLPAFVLASALFAFAAGQPKVRGSEVQDLSNATRAVQQGKGGRISHDQVVLRGNAYRVQTAAEENRARAESGAAHPKWGDTALRK